MLSAVFQLRALLYVLCAFVILNKDYLLTYLCILETPVDNASQSATSPVGLLWQQIVAANFGENVLAMQIQMETETELLLTFADIIKNLK